MPPRRATGPWIHLGKRPVLFTLARALAEAWPGDVSRDVLVARAFRLKLPMNRIARGCAWKSDACGGCSSRLAMSPRQKKALRSRPARAKSWCSRCPWRRSTRTVLALLSDGESWSSSALGMALGTSQRTVQRALDELAAAGKVQSFGRGRSRRWLTPPLPGFTTTLLLPAALSLD